MTTCTYFSQCHSDSITIEERRSREVEAGDPTLAWAGACGAYKAHAAHYATLADYWRRRHDRLYAEDGALMALLERPCTSMATLARLVRILYEHVEEQGVSADVVEMLRAAQDELERIT